MDIRNECCVSTNASNIKVEEKKKVFIVKNPVRKFFLKIQVDGCQIKDGNKCDWLIIDKTNEDEFFVELKGTDVKHAIEQLSATIPQLSNTTNKTKQTNAYVVSSNCPPECKVV